jgi:hypothetical protein
VTQGTNFPPMDTGGEEEPLSPVSAEAEPALCAGCVSPSDAVVTTGCVHEHVTTVGYCKARVNDLRRCAGYLTCSACAGENGSGHVCVPEITAQWPDGTREVIQQAGELRTDEAGRLFGY